MTIEELKGQKIGILGLGVNNWALVVYLLKNGLPLTVRDKNQSVEENFKTEYPELSQMITWQIQSSILGSLEEFTIVFRSPSISSLAPELQKAAKKGVTIYSQTKLFFDLCPAPIIGVTGTKGKGTTTTLIQKILQRSSSLGRVYAAGNIGLDPFSFLDELQATDCVILELSSFQLEDLHRSPELAVVLRVASDHLEYHHTVEAYRQAKLNILRYQETTDIAIINTEYPSMQEFVKMAAGHIYTYTKHQPRRQAAWVDVSTGPEVVFVQLEERVESFSIEGRHLLGEHNLENILPAALVGALYSVPFSAIQEEIVAFTGLEHRLSYVGTGKGVQAYDDSMATTPEACLVAIQSFPGKRLHLLAGGKDKGQKYTAMAHQIVPLCASISLLPGPATTRLHKALQKAIKETKSACLLFEVDASTELIMASILQRLEPHLEKNDVILLAPSAASAEPYGNYKERGDAFVQAITTFFSQE